MAQHKIDNQLKEKLNAREIQPSAPAWDRLDAMLTVSEEKKSKKGYGWFFVAASTMLFFGLGFFIFSSSETTKGNDSIPVVNSVKEEMDSTETNKINQISVEKEQPVLVQNEVNYSKKKARFIQSVEKNELIKEKNIIQENPSPIIHQSSPITYKYVSPDDLLAEVQTSSKVITSDKKTIARPRIQVDANSLLTTVEKELDNTYRETTLDKLTRKFQDTKLALANRNYE
jgi:hypothetical protein